MSKSSQWFSGLICGLMVVCLLALPSAASAKYVPHVLVANSRKFQTRKVDRLLVDPWGIAQVGRNTFWVADQNTSVATAYRDGKILRSKVVEIPCVNPNNGQTEVPCSAAPENPSFPPKLGPTGLVENTYLPNEYFNISYGDRTAPAKLIFDTLGGLIVGWNPHVSRHKGIVAYNNSGNAVYKGLALAPPNIGPYLYASNNMAGGGIDVFDPNFNLVKTFYPTTDSAPYHPHGVDVINGKLYVTYAGMAMGGLIDVCDLDSSSPTSPTCVPFASSTSDADINAPWGIALAPPNFGDFSNDLLVGNVNNGKIVALDPTTGALVGVLEKADGSPISYLGMWDLDFETGRNGRERLYFAAGPGSPPGPGSTLFSEGVFGFISSIGR